MTKKSRKNKYPSVESRTNADGKTKHRGYVRIDGKLVRGPWRDSQRAAYQDVLSMRARADEIRVKDDTPKPMTVRGAAEFVLERSRLEGASEIHAEKLGLQFDRLLRFLEDDVFLEDLGERELIELLARRRRLDKVSSATIGKDIANLRRLYKAAGYSSDRNPAAKLRKPKDETRSKPSVTWEQAQEIVERVRTGRGRRAEFHAAIVEVFVFTGIRAGEFGRLRPVDVEIAEDRSSAILKIQGKRGARRAPIHPDQIPALETLIGDARGARRVHLLPGKTDKARMEYASQVVQRLKKRFDLPALQGARVLRRTLGTQVERIAGLAAARDVLGHADVSMTNRYLVGSDAHLWDVTKRLHEKPTQPDDESSQPKEPTD